jgi:hypothetical protein
LKIYTARETPAAVDFFFKIELYKQSGQVPEARARM